MNVADAGTTRNHRELDRKINGRSGGALLIWIGIALLFGIGWGAGLIGVGAILLAEQLTRWRLAVDPQRFWAVAGIIAVALGAGLVAGLRDALVPIVLIVVGGLLVAATFRTRGAR